jgi:CRP/FNR family transcriptional regulator, cyclic AMP receptor protein
MSRLDAEVGEITHKGGCPTHAFLSGLTEAQLARVQALGDEVTLPEGELILANGQQSTSCYLVLSGSVAVALATPRLTVCVQVVGPGELFGWSALLQGQDTLFQVRAREQTTALRIDGAALSECCRTDPELGVELLQRFLRVVAERVRATETVFAEWCGVRVSGTGG